jgi:hypothetical protein
MHFLQLLSTDALAAEWRPLARTLWQWLALGLLAMLLLPAARGSHALLGLLPLWLLAMPALALFTLYWRALRLA